MISKQSITAAVRKAEPSVNGQLTMRGFAEFGCTTSDTDVDGLFAWYETAGFYIPKSTTCSNRILRSSGKIGGKFSIPQPS
jgi:hypothetical protein